MATIAPDARRQLDRVDLDIGSTEREISQQDRRIIVALRKGEDTTNAENEAEILRIMLENMKLMRHVLMWPWNSTAGQLILLAALMSHAGLGVSTFYRRRHFRIPWTDRIQLTLGLAVPLLLIPHAVNVRAAELLFEIPVSYLRVL